jgi:thioredoxin reductase (NADPH)
LNVPGEDLPHVSHYFQDPHTYFRTRLLVVGGRNSAVEAALRCYQAGAEVSLSYRRAELDPREVKYWLLPEINALVSSGRIAGHFSTVVRRITPTHVTLEAPDGRTSELPADFVLLMIGYEADMALCHAAGVELSEPGRKPVHDPRTMQTNVPGVYVAGTVVAGTQAHYRLFIENCHVHVERIVAALSGRAAGELVEPAPADVLDRPES